MSASLLVRRDKDGPGSQAQHSCRDGLGQERGHCRSRVAVGVVGWTRGPLASLSGEDGSQCHAEGGAKSAVSPVGLVWVRASAEGVNMKQDGQERGRPARRPLPCPTPAPFGPPWALPEEPRVAAWRGPPAEPLSRGNRAPDACASPAESPNAPHPAASPTTEFLWPSQAPGTGACSGREQERTF